MHDQKDKTEREFKREERYIVVKRKNIHPDTQNELREFLRLKQIAPIECVVVEHDWPIYEKVWGMIENIDKRRATNILPAAGDTALEWVNKQIKSIQKQAADSDVELNQFWEYEHYITIQAALSQPEPVSVESFSYPVTVCEVECDNLGDVKAVFAGYYTGECRGALELKANSSVCDLVKITVNGVIDDLNSKGMLNNMVEKRGCDLIDPYSDYLEESNFLGLQAAEKLTIDCFLDYLKSQNIKLMKAGA